VQINRLPPSRSLPVIWFERGVHSQRSLGPSSFHPGVGSPRPSHG
jgi:hypothetical protein